MTVLPWKLLSSEISVLCSNGVEEPMEEPAPEPEPEPEPDPKVEESKPEADEKVLEEMEEKAPSPVPVESPPNTQEPPKVRWMCLCSLLEVNILTLLLILSTQNCLCDSP